MLTAGAQSLTSHEWAAETEAVKGATVTIMTSFDDDGTCTMLMFMDQEIEKAVPGMTKQFLSMVSDYSDLQVSRLRQKLGDDPLVPQWIRTVRGKGYLFEPHRLGVPAAR
jgi:hypothetical protein